MTEQSQRRTILVWLVRTFFGMFITAALLFIPAGRPDWGAGWIYVGSLGVIALLTILVVDPGLIAERNRRVYADQPTWDKVLFRLYGTIIGLVIPLLAGFDLRYTEQSGIPAWGQWIGAAGYILGWGVSLWAMAVNRFFAQVVRIQKDRGQRVVDAGPYRVIRHPGYAGGIVMTVSTPVLLGSGWALTAGLLAGLLLIIRTALEDRVLQEELDGYREYVERVPYRLVPGIW